MNRNARIVLAVAGVLIALATVLSALGAHALQHRLAPDRLATFDVAVRHHFFHALGLLAIGVLMRPGSSRLLGAAAAMVIAGAVLFSGSLYALSFGAPRVLGFVTPFGGLLLIAGWLVFAVAMVFAAPQRE